MKILLLLPLLLGFSVPAIAHNEANGGDVLINPFDKEEKGEEEEDAEFEEWALPPMAEPMDSMSRMAASHLP